MDEEFDGNPCSVFPDILLLVPHGLSGAVELVKTFPFNLMPFRWRQDSDPVYSSQLVC